MNDIATEELGQFFDYIWGAGSPGKAQDFVYLPVQSGRDWTKFSFVWPRQRAGIIRHVLRFSSEGLNVFFSPALFKSSQPVKENVRGSWFLWVDFDGNGPETWEGLPVPAPSLEIQSSLPGHLHCYWQLSEFLDDIELLEDRNRALAYIMKADTSGWDADQVLRPIHTMNYKRGLPVVVKP